MTDKGCLEKMETFFIYLVDIKASKTIYIAISPKNMYEIIDIDIVNHYRIIKPAKPMSYNHIHIVFIITPILAL